MAEVAWSFSRIKSYEDCPRKYWHESVGKTIPFEETEEMSYGKDWHKAAELYIKRGQKLPLSMLHWERVLAKFKSAPGEKIVEQQIALTSSWKQTEWFAKDAWLRVKSDLTIVNGNQAVQIDYKTGKVKDDFTQLRLNSAVTFHLIPELTEIQHGFLWTAHKIITRETMKLADVSSFWATMLPRVQRYQQAHDQQNFPPKPGYLCKKYCKVKSCQFNGV